MTPAPRKSGWKSSEFWGSNGAVAALATVAIDSARSELVQCLAVSGIVIVSVAYTVSRVLTKQPWLIPSISIAQLLKRFLPRSTQPSPAMKSTSGEETKP